MRRAKDGREISVSLSVCAIRNLSDPQSGRASHRISAICRDISSRKAAERDLQETEDFLRDAQVIGGLGYYVLDICSGIWTSSDVLDEIFGIDKSYEHTVEGWTRSMDPDDRAIMATYLAQEVLGAGKKFDKEYRSIRQARLIAALVARTRQAGTGCGRTAGQDAWGDPRITERKTVELQLKESEERYRTTFEQAAVGIVHSAFDGRILRCNRRFSDMVGYSVGQEL